MKKTIAALSASTLSLAVAAQVHAQQGYLGDVAGTAGLETTGLPEMIGNLISVVISLLGIIFLGLTLYAGFLWMTAGGDTDKVGKAKTLLQQGIIGMIIILASLAISNFVFTSLTDAGFDTTA